MIETKSFVFCFDDFEVREREFCLVKSGEVVPVEPKAFRVLLILLRNPKKLIPKDELLQAVWGDTAVTENSLARSIGVLRRLLGDETRDPRFIETVATIGYRFLCKVDVSEDASQKQNTSSEQAAQSEETGSTSAISQRTKIRTKGRRRFIVRSTVAIAPVAGLLLFFAMWKMQPRLPVVSDIVRLTNDHNSKVPINGVVSDGLHLYFMEEQMPGSGSRIAQVSVTGGETTWIPTSLRNALAILDISPDKSKLLLVAGVGGDAESDEFWIQPLPAGTPRRVANLKASTVEWTPDGSQFIYSYQTKIGVVNEDGSNLKILAEVPGSAAWLRYSPDGGLIRFSVLQNLQNSSSLWEMRADGTNLHPLLPNWKESLDQCCGRWSPDGKYYYFLTGSFFLGGGGPSQAIWEFPERRSLFSRSIEPTRLITGPLRFGAPNPSSDGNRIFAVGDESRVELFSYDLHAHRFDPYLGGLSAGPVAFSSDGQWIAYVSYPEMTLWKSRPDLSDKMQLTFPPVRAFAPRWSPDGSQIAFNNVQFHQPWKAYLISTSGGDSPKQIAPSAIADADADATWTSDGKAIVFGRAPEGDRGRQSIYRADLSSGNLTLIPGSSGLFSPRTSPDGRYIAAMTMDQKKLMLLDQNTNSWIALAQADHFDFNEWSPDGKYVYAMANDGQSGKIVRIGIKDRIREDVLSLKGFPLLVDPFADAYGLTPDGKLLLMRDHSVQEIYAFDLAIR